MSVGAGAFWTLVAALGVGTLALRLSFIGLGERFAPPPLLARGLELLPAAIFAALAAQALAVPDGADGARLAAAAVAGLVAWRTGSVLVTMGAGMLLLWLLRAIGL